MLLRLDIDAIFLDYFLKFIWMFLDFAHHLFVANLITMKKILGILIKQIDYTIKNTMI